MKHSGLITRRVDLPKLGFIRTFLCSFLLHSCRFCGGHPFSPFSQLSGKMYIIGLSFPPQHTCKFIYHYRESHAKKCIHRIPLGVLAFAMSFTGPLSRLINPKWIILSGQLLMIIGTVLLAFADTASKYWTLVFPAFVIGSSGAMLTYTHTKSVFQFPIRSYAYLHGIQYCYIPHDTSFHGRDGRCHV